MASNGYAVIIVVALVGGWAVSLLADWLNLRALAPRPPAGLRDLYDPDAYAQSQAYTRAATRFGIVTAAVDLVVFFAFWWLGGFAWLDGWVRALGWALPLDGLLFMGVLVLFQSLLSLPASIYRTFVLEARFGFNRTTPRTFVIDLVKGLVLAAALGGPALAVILLFFDRAGVHAWWLCWLAGSVFLVVIQLVLPTWILPLFNRFTPLEDGSLRQALADYARRVGVALSGVFVIDGSRRSTRANAFVSGIGRNKRIALFDTLIEQQTVPELVAVLAHEVGHAKHRHLLKGLLLAAAHLGVLFFLLSRVLQADGLYQAFGVAEPSIHAGLVFFGLLYTPIELVLAVAMNAWMRQHELEADRYAAGTADPAALASALRKLARENLVNLTPHPFYVALHHSHPPLGVRLGALAEEEIDVHA